MTPEEIRTRAAYLVRSCADLVEQLIPRLTATVPPPLRVTTPPIDRVFRRELGLLFRYWTTRQIWERLEWNEDDAKRLNLVLLRSFTEEFKLPQDGSGLRYAELATAEEELQELIRRLASALRVEPPLLVAELQARIHASREAINRHTLAALELPLEGLGAQGP